MGFMCGARLLLRTCGEEAAEEDDLCQREPPHRNQSESRSRVGDPIATAAARPPNHHSAQGRAPAAGLAAAGEAGAVIGRRVLKGGLAPGGDWLRLEPEPGAEGRAGGAGVTPMPTPTQGGRSWAARALRGA